MGTVLFVINQFSDINRSARKIERLRGEGKNVIALGLDFFICKELQDRNITFRRPSEYLCISDCSRIDEQGARLTRSWYKPLNNILTYRGVSVGEIAEFDFLYLFFDAFRGIEISQAIFNTESPDEIFLPTKVPLAWPSHACYETLPGTLHYIAKLNSVHVYNTPLNHKALFVSKMKSFIMRKAYGPAQTIRAKLRLARLSFLLKNSTEWENRVLFVGVPSQSLIEKEMNDKTIAFNMPLASMATKNGKQQIKIIKNYWNEFLEDQKQKKTLEYKGIPLIDVLLERFRQYFLEEFGDYIRYIDGCYREVKIVKPSIIVTTADTPPLRRIAVKTAGISGIPALSIQHGLIGRIVPGFYFETAECDKHAVWGRKAKELFANMGESPDSLIITGNPRYDILASKRFDKGEMYAALGLDMKKGVIVIATAWFAGLSVCATPDPVISFVKVVLQALKNVPEKQVVIKLHPGYHQEYHKIFTAVAEEIGIDVVITKDYLWELLDSCDVVITSGSTVALEAMMLDRIVVDVSLNKQEAVSYTSSEALLRVSEPAEIVPAIKQALYDEAVQARFADARKDFIYDYAHEQDGKASKRVADLIMHMIEQSRKREIEHGSPLLSN